VKLRLNGELLDDAPAPLAGPEAEAILLGGLEPEQAELFDRHGELDFAYTIPGVGRFRANVYRQHRGMNGIFRVIPPSPPTLQDLGLPATLARVVNFHQGLVLLTGPAGCGKSSTLAALIDILNTERRDHILTIEDPIEHLHPSKRCVVNQRQVSRHTESFARALRAALREDPDIIVIGELRDRETISLALTAAETGHLVLGTLHTNSAIRTINRILGVFPPNQQSQIRTMISESLKAIVSQRLIRTTDGKRRVAALEILMCNKAVGNLIREGKTFQIISVLQTGAPQGMALMESSLAALVKAGTIGKDEALKLCDDPKRLVA
jgi:twitching motility protein PilT